MAQQGSGGIDSFLTSNFLSNFKYNNNTAEQQQQTPHNVGNAIFLTGSSSTSSQNNNTIREWFSSKQNSFSSPSSSNFFQQQQSNSLLHFNPLVTTSLPISRSLSDNSLPKYQFYQSSTTNNNNNNNTLIEASSKKKRKRCDEEFEEDEEYAGFSSSELSSSMGEIDLMREAMILPTNVDMIEENGMMTTNMNNSNNNNGEDSSSMFFPQSMFGNSMMQFSSQHQSHNAFPLFESEEDMITSASPTAPVKKNRMSPQSHLIEFIRDNIMQYLLFHLKLDMRQTITSETSSVTTLQLDDVKMSDSTTTTDDEYSVGGVEQDVDITIPVGLLLDYIVQQAQRLYFNMYEYIRELASSPIKYQCKSVENQKEIELSLACNEFEKMVIEQVHFLLSQIELMRYNNQTSSSSSNQTITQIIPMLKKYDKILPKNFHTLRLVSSTSDDSIGSNADSFTLEGIVDESFLFKSTSPYIQRSSFAHNFDDMKTNSSLNDISSLLLNTKFKLSY